MKIGLVYARSRNGVIGKDGVMPWRLSEDMVHFKHVTMGAPVVMGRKTWDSIPPKFRPLPGRRNIVITRQDEWHPEGAETSSSLERALEMCAGAPQVWVIGGGQIYAQAAPIADTAEVTEIDADYEGDTFAPQLGAHWQESHRERHIAANGMHYSFVTLRNTQKNS